MTGDAMPEGFVIRLKIAGKSFPLTIKREDEEKYRRAEKEVNALIEKYRARFRAGEDEYMAMAALQLAVGGVEMEMQGSLDNDVQQLRALESELDRYLDEI